MTFAELMRREPTPEVRWWVDHRGCAYVRVGIKLTPQEIEEITRQVHECRPGRPN